ncbi:MAG: LURP-one-related family protein [Microlunatus sp.]|nr:LURP-one-related family protein [Microlunatus sp.]MDN5769274.1 LURP-one-related family protein [Microlunatus sp.]
MGLRHHGLDGPTFQMREKIFAIGDDFWIEDDNGNKAYKVDGKAVRLRDTFILEDAHGNEVSKIQEKKLSVRDKMTIERGATKATVHKRLIGIRDHYIVDVDGGEDLKAHGNIVDHEYEIERDGKKVAEVSKKWFRVRDTYGVQLAQGQDVPLILAITVCLDQMAHG